MLDHALYLRMGEVAWLSTAWEAPDEPMVSVEPTFEEFFEDHRERLLKVLSVVTGSRTEAEDIAQDAFMRILERWESVRLMENATGYLYRTALNVFRSRYRRTSVAIRTATGVGPERDVFADVEARDLAAQALARLSKRQRAALVLTELLGFSGAEAGEILGIRASTVWALTHQARTALRASGEDRDDV